MQLALASMTLNIVDEEQHRGRHGTSVHEASAGEEGSQPTLALILLVVAMPCLSPAMGKVNYENQLNQNK